MNPLKSKPRVGLGALGSYFLGYHKNKNHQSKFSIPSKKKFKKRMKIKISSTKIFNSFKKFKIFKKQMKIKISSTKVFNSFKKLKIFKKEKKNFINQNFQFLQKNSRAPKFSQKKSSLIKIFNCFTKKKKKKKNLH